MIRGQSLGIDSAVPEIPSAKSDGPMQALAPMFDDIRDAKNIDSIIADCCRISSDKVSKRTPAFLVRKRLAENDFRDCWASFVMWINTEIEQDRSAYIPDFGTIGHRTYNLGIRIPQFIISKSFANRHGLSLNEIPKKASSYYLPARSKFDPIHVANEFSPLGVEDFMVALSILLDAIGNAMGHGDRVDIDFGGMIGHLQCEGPTLRPTFIQATPEVSSLSPSLNVALDANYIANKMHFSRSHSPSRIPTNNIQRPASRSASSHGMRSRGKQSGERPTSVPLPADFKFNPAPPRNSKGGRNSDRHSRGGRVVESKQQSLSNLPFASRTINLKNQGMSMASKRSAHLPSSKFRTKRALDTTKGDSGWSAVSVHTSGNLQAQPVIDSDYFSKPPLINRFCRTKAAEIDPDSELRSSVDRIGSNYTPPATKLSFSSEVGIVCINTTQWHELSTRKIVQGSKPILVSDTTGTPDAGAQGWRLSFPLSDVGGNRVSLDMALGQYGHPSGRTSDILFEEKCATQKIANHKALLLQSQRAAENPASRIAYEWYIVNGISANSVADPSASLNLHLLNLLPDLAQLRSIPSKRVEECLRLLFDEIRLSYQQSVKKSILDYMLRNSATRARVGIQAIPRDYLTYHWWEWGLHRLKFSIVTETTDIKQPMFHTELCRRMQSIEYRLKWMDNLTLSISNLWEKYETLLLVDVPSTDEEAFKMKWSPIEISQFKLRQEDAAKHTKSVLERQWWPEVIRVYSEMVGKDEKKIDELRLRIAQGLDLGQLSEDTGITNFFNASAIFSGLCPNKEVVHHYLNALSTLIYRQLRMVVENSVTAMVRFMDRFKFGKDTKRHSSIAPPFLIGLSINTEEFKVSCKTSLEKIVDVIQEIVLQIPRYFSGWARLEHRGYQELSHIGGYSTVKYIWEVKETEELIVDGIQQIKGVLKEAEVPMQALLESYDRFNFLQDENVTVRKICEGDRTEELDTNIYRERLKVLQNAETSVHANTSDSHDLTVVMVTCVELNMSIVKFIRLLKSKLLSNFENRSITSNYKIVDSFKHTSLAIAKKPIDTMQLVAMEAYIADAKTGAMSKLSQDVDMSRSQLHFLFVEGHRVALPLLHSIGSCVDWATRTPPLFQDAEKNLALTRVRMEGQFRLSHKNFMSSITELGERVMEFQSKGDIRHLSLFMEQLETLQNETADLFGQAEEYQAEENLLGWPVTDFVELTGIEESMKPFIKMWTNAKNFKENHREWLHGNVFELDINIVQQTVSTMVSSMLSVVDKLSENFPTAVSVAESVKDQLDLFKPFIPLIGAVANKGLRERHWEEVAHLVGFIIDPEEVCSLQRLLDRGCGDHISELEMISDSASKEWGIEKSLDHMQHEWEKISFEVQPFLQTKTHILVESTVDEISNIIDEELVKVQNMKVSEYAPPHFQRILNLEEFLIQLQEIVAVWMKVQRLWVHLSPIFASDDVAKQMPDEARDFQLVDGNWRTIMNSARKNLICQEIIQIKHLLSQLDNSLMLLERIQKNLHHHLEIKCTNFPRFFFLARDDILKIVSQNIDPENVQQYLSKCFDGVHRFKLDGKNIMGLLSQNGEEIRLLTPINTSHAKGSVEILLHDVEKAMKLSLARTVTNAIEDYPSKEWKQWILEWPGQALSVASQLYWTASIENLLNEGVSKAGYANLLASKERIQQCTSSLKTVTSPNSAKLITFSNLIMVELHQCDVISKLISAPEVNENSFLWQGQLRHYVERNEMVTTKVLNSVLKYKYEYIGNKSRIVLTPLTDRCYHAMFSAVAEHFGGAIVGSAGSGKSETLLDISRAVGTYFVQFCCSQSILFTSFTRIFKGMTSTGSWVCFDNLDTLLPHVLGVVSQQLKEVLQASSSDQSEFEFDGHTTPVTLGSAVFATIQHAPAYLRGHLPLSIRNQFRHFALQVPSLRKIAEVILCGHGFEDSANIALKIMLLFQSAQSFRVSRGQFDFGTRLLKDTLAYAGTAKYPQNADGIAQSIHFVLGPKLDVAGRKTFRILCKDIFGWEGADNSASSMQPSRSFEQPDNTSTLLLQKFGTHDMSLDVEEPFAAQLQMLEQVMDTSYGVLLVGETLSGKSLSLDIMRRYRQKLLGLSDHSIHISTINPRSLSFDELFGFMTEASSEWISGLFSFVLRQSLEFIENSMEDRYQWIVFDGIMNDVWLESLTSIFDSNHHYYQRNGEVVHICDQIKFIFECDTLESAAPSFVSRCGVSFMQKESLSWQTAFGKWLRGIETIVKSKSHIDDISKLFMWLLPAALTIGKSLNDSSFRQNDAALACSVMSIMEGLLSKLNEEDFIGYEAEAELTTVKDDTGSQQLPQPDKSNGEDEGSPSSHSGIHHAIGQEIQSSFIFALLWGVGSTFSENCKRAFEKKLKQVLTGRHSQYPPPRSTPFFEDVPLSASCLYEFVFVPSWLVASVESNENHVSKNGWKRWEIDDVLADIPSEPAHISQVVVPTATFISSQYFMRISTMAKHNILFVGSTGTGKSKMLEHYIQSGAPGDPGRLHVLHLPCSAYTKSTDLVNIAEERFEKRRRGVYGPTLNKVGALFIDDVHLPSLDAQSPVELLRNIADHGGWYDKLDNTFQKFDDRQIIATMNTQGNPRLAQHARFIRHFLVMGLPDINAAMMTEILTQISEWHVTKESLVEHVQEMYKSIILATVSLCETCSLQFLPSPEKAHYSFTLHDCKRVLEGMSLTSSGVLDKHEHQLIVVWIHDILRAFYDKLVCETERQRLLDIIREDVVLDTLHKRFDQLLPHLDKNKDGKVNTTAEIDYLTFGDFMSKDSEPHVYDEMTDYNDLGQIFEEYLEEYNAVSEKPMQLILFTWAIQFICRVTRVLKMVGGHIIVVGSIGIGKQSLSRLAISISECDMVETNFSRRYNTDDWRDDLKRLLSKVGGDGKPTTFLVKDEDIVNDLFLDDIYKIMVCGEVPNLLSYEERQQAIERVQASTSSSGLGQFTEKELWHFFLQRVKHNLHFVFCLSTDAKRVQECVRRIPGLMTACTVCWLQSWPAEALEHIGKKLIADVCISPDVKHDSINVCVKLYQDILQHAHNCGGPTRQIRVMANDFMESIQIFKIVLAEKRINLKATRSRYEIGLEKLHFSAEQVVNMRQELIRLQPVLVSTTKETEQMIQVVEKEKAVVDKIRYVVLAEEEVAKQKAEESKVIKEECERELTEAMPEYNSALQALDALTKGDIGEVKAMVKPPDGVKLVMEALCLMFDIKPTRSKEGDLDYWEPSKKELLTDPYFLRSLVEYDKNNIPAAVIVKLQLFIKNPEFTPERVKKASKAASGICVWVRAMVYYDRAMKDLEPKKQKLATAEAEYETVMKGLQEKQGELEALESKLENLGYRLVECERQKSNLEKEVLDCTSRLDRAEKLIRGLGGEQNKWTAEAELLQISHQNLTGDTLLCAAYVSYLGSFGVNDRERIFGEWKNIASFHSLQTSDAMNILHILGNPNSIRTWKLAGLSSDAHSIQNAVIAERSRRWPLMVDPHNVALDWIMNTAKKAGKELKIADVNQHNFVRVVETALEQGRTLIIKGVRGELDPMLDPVLLKQITRRGGNWCVSYGGKSVKFNDQFKLYMLSARCGSDFPASLFLKTKVIDCSMTQDSLQERLLSFVVMKEMPDIEERKQSIDEQSADNDKQLKELEDKILLVLSSSSGNILDDSTAIEVLTRSKQVADNINIKQEENQKIIKGIDEARFKYGPVAKRSSSLFFCIRSMSNISPSYQFSLNDFVKLFQEALKSDLDNGTTDIKARIANINSSFLDLIYKRICVAFFSADQVLFKLLLAITVEQSRADRPIDSKDFNFFATLPAKEVEHLEECPSWLPQEVYQNVSKLSFVSQQLKWVFNSLCNESPIWRVFFESPDPFQHCIMNENGELVSGFEKLCLVKTFRPDKVLEAVATYIADELGEQYVESTVVNLEDMILMDNDGKSVFIFALAESVDPSAELEALARSQGLEVLQVSLGDGDMAKAEKAIADGRQTGKWVILNNCHLCLQWIDRLEQLCDEILSKSETVDAGTGVAERSDFRLMLTIDRASNISHALYRKCINIACDQPKGLKARLSHAMQNQIVLEEDDIFASNSHKSEVFKRLALAVCQFHAHAHENVHNGPFHWESLVSIYEQDLNMALPLIRDYVASHDVQKIPLVLWDMMYWIGDYVYGAQSSNEIHMLAILSILHVYMSNELEKMGCVETTQSGTHEIAEQNAKGIRDGVGQNKARMTVDETDFLMRARSIGVVEGGVVGSTQNDASFFRSFGIAFLPDSVQGVFQSLSGQTVQNIYQDLLNKCPALFNVDAVYKKFPASEKMLQNALLLNEIARYNLLLKRIRSSLETIILALAGGRCFDDSSHGALAMSILQNTVPLGWAQVSYASAKSLEEFMDDLSCRVAFIKKEWIDFGKIPRIFWVGCMFEVSPLCYILCQEFAARDQIPLHEVRLDVTIVHKDDILLKNVNGHVDLADGIFLCGIFVSGATWSNDDMSLTGAHDPRQVVPSCTSNPMPHIWLQPYHDSGGMDKDQNRSDSVEIAMQMLARNDTSRGDGGKESIEFPLFGTCYPQDGQRSGVRGSNSENAPILYISVPVKKDTGWSRQQWLSQGVVLSCMQ